MEETLEGGRGPPRAVAPLEEEEFFSSNELKYVNKLYIFINSMN